MTTRRMPGIQDLAEHAPKKGNGMCPTCGQRLPRHSSVGKRSPIVGSRCPNCTKPRSPGGLPPPSGDVDPEDDTVKVPVLDCLCPDDVCDPDADSEQGGQPQKPVYNPAPPVVTDDEDTPLESPADPDDEPIIKASPPILAAEPKMNKPAPRERKPAKETHMATKLDDVKVDIDQINKKLDRKPIWPWILAICCPLIMLLLCAGLGLGGYRLLGFGGETPVTEAKVEPPPAPVPAPVAPITPPIEIASAEERPEGPLILDCGGKWPTSGPDTYRFDFTVEWSVLGQEAYFVSGIHPAKGLAGIVDGACVTATGHTVPVDRITQVHAAERSTKVWLAFENGQPPRGEHHTHDIVVRCDKATHNACVEKQLAKR